MSDNEEQRRDIVAQGAKASTVIPLGPNAAVDLSFLPEAERNALLTDYARGALDVAKKAQDLHVEVGAFKNVLDNMARTAKDVTDSGNAGTLTYSKTGNMGRVEVKIGNTEEAKSGKLSSSQGGQTDWNPIYIFAAIVAVVIIAFLALHR